MTNNTFRLLASGAAFRATSLVLNILIAFFLMPYLIDMLGDRWYGVWVIVGTIIGYYGLLDFGLGSACQRFISKAYGEKDCDKVNTALSTGFFTFTLTSIVAFVITLSLAYSADLFFDEQTEASTFKYLMLIMGSKLIFTLPLSSYNGVVTAHLRYDISSTVEFCKTFLRAILFYLVLEKGYNIIALATITTLIEVIGVFYIRFFCKRLDPNLNISWRSFSPRELLTFFNFGKYSFIIDLANVFRFQIDNIVIASIISLSQVTHFVIAGRLIEYMGQLFSSIMGLFLPVFAKMHGQNQQALMTSRLMIVLNLSTFISITFCFTAILIGSQFIHIWMGTDYLDAYPVLVTLSISSVLGLLTVPLNSYLYAIAKHRHYAYVTLVEAFFNLLLSITLGKYFGILGVALGTAIPVIISKAMFVIPYALKQANISVQSFYLFLIKSVGLAVLIFGVSYKLFESQVGSHNLVELSLIAILTAVTYGLIFFVFVAEKETVAYLKHKIPKRYV